METWKSVFSCQLSHHSKYGSSTGKFHSKLAVACKYLRRRCASDCIFSPYFPSDNPQRFSCVHKIYGASNVGKMLQQLPVHLRAEAADSLYFEAHSRKEDPVYGCVGIITNLHEEIHDAEIQLAKIQAHIGFHRHSDTLEDGETSQSGHGQQQ